MINILSSNCKEFNPGFSFIVFIKATSKSVNGSLIGSLNGSTLKIKFGNVTLKKFSVGSKSGCFSCPSYNYSKFKPVNQ